MKKRLKTTVILIGAVAIIIYQETLIAWPIILFGPILGSSLLFAGMFGLACLVCYYAPPNKQNHHLSRILKKISQKSTFFAAWLEKLGKLIGFLVISLFAGALIMSYINKTHIGTSGTKLYFLSCISSLIFSFAWGLIYSGLWAKILNQPYIFK